MTEPIQCPFCGGRDIEFQTTTPDREGTPTNAICDGCGACGPWVYERAGEKEQAILEWNKRTSEPTRIIPIGDLNLKQNASYSITILPGDMALLEATDTEREILRLYAEEVAKLKPDRITASTK